MELFGAKFTISSKQSPFNTSLIKGTMWEMGTLQTPVDGLQTSEVLSGPQNVRNELPKTIRLLGIPLGSRHLLPYRRTAHYRLETKYHIHSIRRSPLNDST
jgi:hypothetical protein